jgi:hypothetical protein
MVDVPYILADPENPSGSSPDIGPISLTDDDVLQVLGDFWKLIIPGISIMQGQPNRGPMPMTPDFVIMTPADGIQLSTTIHDYDGTSTNTISRSTQFDVQLDVYGPASRNNAQVFTLLFRDAYGCNAMDGTGVQPLFCDDGHQMPLVAGEKQYEQRWMIRASLQITPGVSTPAQFADNVAAIVIEVD